jgi:hypothetical protein
MARANLTTEKVFFQEKEIGHHLTLGKTSSQIKEFWNFLRDSNGGTGKEENVTRPSAGLPAFFYRPHLDLLSFMLPGLLARTSFPPSFFSSCDKPGIGSTIHCRYHTQFFLPSTLIQRKSKCNYTTCYKRRNDDKAGKMKTPED